MIKHVLAHQLHRGNSLKAKKANAIYFNLPRKLNSPSE
jgi:hypothetical protein